MYKKGSPLQELKTMPFKSEARKYSPWATGDSLNQVANLTAPIYTWNLFFFTTKGDFSIGEHDILNTQSFVDW